MTISDEKKDKLSIIIAELPVPVMMPPMWPTSRSITSLRLHLKVIRPLSICIAHHPSVASQKSDTKYDTRFCLTGLWRVVNAIEHFGIKMPAVVGHLPANGLWRVKIKSCLSPERKRGRVLLI